MKTNDSRLTALDILCDVLQRGSFANLSLKYGLEKEGVNDVDKRFISTIVYGTINNLLRIDYILSHYININKTSALIVNILRMSIYQLLYMDRVPAYSICSEAVSMTKQCTNQRMGNFVNAVLRNCIRNMDSIEYPSDKIEYLSVMYSYPEWIVRMWIDDYGMKDAEGLITYEIEKHKLCIRPNGIRMNTKHFEQVLHDKGIDFERGKYLENCYYVDAAGISEHLLYSEGFYSIQSESSMLCVEAAAPEEGMNVLDACSAPGGKAVYMAEKMKNTGNVIACDLHEHKIDLIRKNADRTGTDIVHPRCSDATVFYSAWEKRFDLVLADVPCSGFGIRASKPEIKLQRDSRCVNDLVKLQEKIIENVCKYVRPGGVLIYSTCTVNRNENDRQIEKFLSKHNDFYLEKINLPQFGERANSGMIQLFQSIDGIDGFFIARLRRKD